jgi:Raf kinase inhibitor-like YbhB/YbcL family protein
MIIGKKWRFAILFLFSGLISAQTKGGTMAFQITSSAFANGGTIAKNYTCDGPDIAPPLAWTGAPSGTQSFALIADDPDAPAGTWVHWVLYNLPGTAKELAEGARKEEQLPDGTEQGRNDFRKIGYNGPCPPAGKPHRYFFKLYALGAKLGLKPGASKAEVESAMKGHILAQAELVGKYGR